VIGATVIVAFAVISLLTFGAASGRPVAQHRSGDAATARNAMSSTHQLSRAQGHASSVSRASGHAAQHSLSSSSHSLFHAARSSSAASSSAARLLAATGCGSSGPPDSIADQTGFEDADGNLDPNTFADGCKDWNSFSPTWIGNAGTATLGGLSFVGRTDPVNSSSDSIYSGGVKQDTTCPGVTTGNVNDKADLGRIYVATETLNGHVYLFLAWERQIDNTINSDVFVSFEFDQGKLACTNNDGFVQRTKGDLLFDYNFQSGNSTIDAKEWDGSTWVALPTPPFEAAVNSGTVTDTIGPNGSVSLTKFEFGEAGIDLTALDLSGNGGKACETFGSVLGGSRTSKSGDNAQLKDYVGPAPIEVSNCVKPSISTTIKNAADDSTVSGALPLGSSVYDTATLGGLISGKDPTGTLNFTFFTNGTCSGDGTPAGTGVALNGHSDTEGPLAAGSYSFEAQYISGNDPNYTDSDVSACEPLTISQGSLTPSTTIKNAADDSVVSGALPLGSSVYDTTSLSGQVNGFDPTGTIQYRFFQTIGCTGDSTSAGDSVALGDPSDTEGPLGSGSYSFEARYVAGTNDNYPTSAYSACEPLTISQGSLTPSTTIKNAADDSIVDNSSSLPLNSSVYDTTQIAGAVNGFDPAGTIEYRFFTSSDCSTGSSSAGTGKPLNGQSNTEGPLSAGNYSFDARYVAGTNDNYPTTDWSACEPFSVGLGAVAVTTGLTNAADDSPVANGSSLPLGSSVYDTSQVSGLVEGQPATGSIEYRFFQNGDCSGDGASAGTGVALDGQSDTEGPLGTGSYSFDARYVGGANDNYGTSDWSSCEPFTINQGSLTPSTTIKNAADDSPVDGPLALGSSVYDTTQISGAVNGFDPAGTIQYRFFTSGDCSGDSTSAGDSVALGDPSNTEGPLGAGNYSFDARYVAGQNDNYPTSDWSACEPMSVAVATPSVTTVLKNEADDSTIENGSTLPLGSSVYDTSQLSGLVEGQPATGSIEYRFFQNGDCSGEGSSAGSGIELGGESNTEGPLGAGSYSFDARYVAGENDNYASSDWSGCEPFTVGATAPSASTTLKNAGTNATIQNGSTLPHGSSVYDTAQITAPDSFPLTGTVSFRFFHNGACTGTPASVQTGVAVGSNSAATGPLDAGSYAFQAMYVAGNDPNHTDSAWSACEPFTIAPLIDLAITKSGSPATQTLGDGNITWTMVVTNNGPDTATGVMISDPMPAGNTFVSATASHGSCTGGAILSCSLGTIPAAGTVTITLVTTPSTVGAQVNTVTVVGNETESNTANNTATATVQTVGVITPPVFCVAVSKVTPKQLFVGRKTKLTIHVTQNKKAVSGVRVRIKGPHVNLRTKPSNSRGVIVQQVKMKKAGILTFTPIADKKCNTKRVGITQVFTPPVTG
jgi:uncharacterized repeat protein (TIGR01451 family)